MTLDNIYGITKGSYTGDDLFCKSQLITCNRVKECNGVCPFEDALKHADKEMNEQTVIDHDRDWIIGCIQHDGFIKTDRFDKANQIILEALEVQNFHINTDAPSATNHEKVQNCGDLISRAKVLNVVQNADDGNIPYEIIKDIIQGLPSVSAERVGEWTAEIGYEGEVIYYECSNCKEAFSLLEGTPEENRYNYCPNCGARMKGGAE